MLKYACTPKNGQNMHYIAFICARIFLSTLAITMKTVFFNSGSRCNVTTWKSEIVLRLALLKLHEMLHLNSVSFTFRLVRQLFAKKSSVYLVKKNRVEFTSSSCYSEEFGWIFIYPSRTGIYAVTFSYQKSHCRVFTVWIMQVKNCCCSDLHQFIFD